jgi:C-terminal processing protease CtpA/Prc
VLRKLLTGDPGTKTSFTFERSDGSRFDTTLGRKRISARPGESHRILPGGYGYLRFTQWTIGVTAEVIQGLEAGRTHRAS